MFKLIIIGIVTILIIMFINSFDWKNNDNIEEDYLADYMDYEYCRCSNKYDNLDTGK